MLLVGQARECAAAGRKPGETSANPGTALLVLGPELSNYYSFIMESCHTLPKPAHTTSK